MRRRIRLLTSAYKEEPMRSLALLALSLATAVAFAQPNVRVRGTITGLNGDVLSVKSRDGKDLQVRLTPEAQVAVAKKTAPADIKPRTHAAATKEPGLMSASAAFLATAT